MGEVFTKFAWVLQQWWFWVALVGYYVLIGLAWWYFTGRRDYKTVNGKLMVRHGRFGQWVEIEGHLHENHSISDNRN